MKAITFQGTVRDQARMNHDDWLDLESPSLHHPQKMGS